jgi:tRNA pseudouridine-54 N-methylase
LRYFILTAEWFSRIDRQEIDKGTLKRETIAIVNCVRSSLFTSYGLRKDVNVLLYPLDPGEALVKIEGDKLRYMGPDERSISMLLSVPVNKLLHETIKDSEVTSPGISVVKETPAGMIEGLENPLVLYPKSDGQEVRRIKFGDRTVYIDSIDPRMDLKDEVLFPTKCVKCPIESVDVRCENTILLLNNEIDRKIGQHLQHP